MHPNKWNHTVLRCGTDLEVRFGQRKRWKRQTNPQFICVNGHLLLEIKGLDMKRRLQHDTWVAKKFSKDTEKTCIRNTLQRLDNLR